MSEPEFTHGDIVTLRSGGLPMTIEALDTGDACLVWMSADGRLRRERVPAACLRHSQGEFDGVADLIIEGVTHTCVEIRDRLQVLGND